MPVIFFVTCPSCKTRFYADRFIYDAGPEADLLCPNCLLQFQRKEGLKVVTMFSAPGAEDQQRN